MNNSFYVVSSPNEKLLLRYLPKIVFVGPLIFQKLSTINETICQKRNNIISLEKNLLVILFEISCIIPQKS